MKIKIDFKEYIKKLIKEIALKEEDEEEEDAPEIQPDDKGLPIGDTEPGAPPPDKRNVNIFGTGQEPSLNDPPPPPPPPPPPAPAPPPPPPPAEPEPEQEPAKQQAPPPPSTPPPPPPPQGGDEPEPEPEEPEIPTITIEDAKTIIKATKGRFFTCTFIKRTDGTKRVMNARLGVKAYLRGGELPYDPEEKRLIPVFDVQKKAYRMINIDGIIHLKVGNKEYNVKG